MEISVRFLSGGFFLVSQKQNNPAGEALKISRKPDKKHLNKT